MKKLLLTILLGSFSVFAQTNQDQANWQKNLYDALKVKATTLEENQYGLIKIHTKEISGLLTCQYHEYITAYGTSYYKCLIGSLDGYSMADQVFNYLNTPGELIYDGDKGKVYQVKFGPLVCQKLVYKTPVGDDAPLYDQQGCIYTQRFGFFPDAEKF